MSDLSDKVQDLAQSQTETAVQAVGRGLEQMGQRLRKQDTEVTLSDLKHYARLNPVSFLACAAAIGFAVTRIGPEAEMVRVQTRTPMP